MSGIRDNASERFNPSSTASGPAWTRYGLHGENRPVDARSSTTGDTERGSGPHGWEWAAYNLGRVHPENQSGAGPSTTARIGGGDGMQVVPDPGIQVAYGTGPQVVPSHDAPQVVSDPGMQVVQHGVMPSAVYTQARRPIPYSPEDV